MIENNLIRSLGWIILPVRFAPLISLVSRVKLLIRPDIGRSSQNNLILVISLSNQKYTWHDGIQFFPCVSSVWYRWMQQIDLTLIIPIGSILDWVHLPSNFPLRKMVHSGTKTYHICTWIRLWGINIGWFRWIVLIPNLVLLGAREDMTGFSWNGSWYCLKFKGVVWVLFWVLEVSIVTFYLQKNRVSLFFV